MLLSIIIVELGSIGSGDFYCKDRQYRFLNDSILEIKSSANSEFYEMQTTYSYRKLNDGGIVDTLEAERLFDFTKFTLIDEDYFNGCFIKFMTAEEGETKIVDDLGRIGIWQTEHLSIADLDLMRNEIYAEYGLKFKTQKWRDYFEQQDWYEPRWDNVDDLLSEIEKANIKIILKVKEAMKGNENGFINKTSGIYAVAG